MSTCAVGPCQQPRGEGSSYCEKHGPTPARGKAKVTNLKGTLSPVMVCPHCQAKGGVRTRSVKRNKGVKAGKVGAAVMTGGLSLFSIGLAGKQRVTVAHCDECRADWEF